MVTDDELDRMADYQEQQQQRVANAGEPAKRAQQMRQHAHVTIERKNREIDANGARAARQELVRQKTVNLEKVSALEHEAWRLRTMGKKVYEIAETMGTTRVQVNAWLQDALAQVRSATTELIELDKELELSRTETLLAHYMPLALHDAIVIERIERGEPVGIDDFEQPQRCAYVCIELLKLRAKLKGLVISQAEQSLMPGDVLGWLSMQRDFIRRAVDAAPRDVLTLEVDEPIDEQKENRTNSGTVPDALRIKKEDPAGTATVNLGSAEGIPPAL